VKSKKLNLNNSIPTLDLKKEYSFLRKDINKQLSECFKSQHWILGAKVEALEEKIANITKVKFARGVASGTDALIIALRALAIDTRRKQYFDNTDEIITTPFSFVATAEAIYRSGARPVFVDIDPETFNIDASEVAKAITKKTVGILPVHLYGQACRMDKLQSIARRENIFMVEDCAQSFGATYKSAKVGSFGDCGAFSFFPSKNLGCFGDGGCITTNDYKLAEHIDILRGHGQKSYADALCIGYNSRLDAIQAAILLAKLKYINKFISMRRAVASIYDKGLGGSKYLQTPAVDKNCFHAYGLYTVKVSKKRDELVSYLNDKGIGARIYYHKPLFAMKAFSKARIFGQLPGLNSVMGKVLSLPIYPFLTLNQANRIVKAVHRFYNK
jgi:dTDP-4-amino-4,6-dideoxygalactose transaminase